MVTIPDRLFEEPFVTLFHRSPHLVVMHKSLDRGIENRQSYVAKHAISIVIKGTQRIQTQEGPILVIPEGHMGFMGKGVYSVTDMLSDTQGFESYHIFFDDLYLEQLLSELAITPTDIVHSSVFLKREVPSIAALWFEQLHHIHQWRTSGIEDLMKLKVKELFVMLRMEDTDQHLAAFLLGLKQRHVRNLLQFMQTHYDKPLTVGDYASLTGRSVSTFRREFKAKFGLAPKKWIMQQRMEKARDLVAHTQLNVTDIAAAVGYENISHFISAFKKHYGQTPKQFEREGI
ncbi:MAG: AraC family transcriptional regulator [Bacteroidota bacterium]